MSESESGKGSRQFHLPAMIAQQGTVDWFAFWLKSEENPGPAEAEQYKRWREMRKSHEENEKKTAHAAPVLH